MCCGESLGIRDANEYIEFVTAQVDAGLAGLDDIDMKNVVIAYEPIWAIGTGRTATPEQAEEVCEGIRTVVRKLYSSKNARAISILYGGSMNEKNAYELLSQPDIDGGLIGGASLVPEKFVKIIEAANQPTV
jgi:triosephosphate isomerase